MENEYNKSIKKLDEELNKYSFDVKELSDTDKTEIKNLYTMLWKIYSNKVFIENIEKANIRITEKILINNKESYTNHVISNHTTLYFVNCKNITINITQKVCHITLENCESVNIKTRGGAITGLDAINCKNVNHVLEKSNVYLLEISNCIGCIYYISEDNALNTLISSYGSPDIKIITTCPISGNIKNKFNPAISFFEIYRLYSFEKNNEIIQLYYVTPTNKKIQVNCTSSLQQL